ncbi:MAG: hypothetical protein WCO07_00150 [bacterium]
MEKKTLDIAIKTIADQHVERMLEMYKETMNDKEELRQEIMWGAEKVGCSFNEYAEFMHLVIQETKKELVKRIEDFEKKVAGLGMISV